MNFCWVTLTVKNMEESLKFYHELLGLPVYSARKSGELDIVFLGEEGKTRVELIYDPAQKGGSAGNGMTIGFEVDDLDETVRFLESKGVGVARGPFSPNPHLRFLFVQDPSGFEVQLVEHR